MVFLLFAVVSVGLASERNGFRQFGEPATEQDKAAIESLLATMARGWRTGDAEMAASVYAEDAEWMNAYGEILYGTEAVKTRLAELFASTGDAEEAGEQEHGSVSLRYLGDEAAIYHGYVYSDRTESRTGEDQREVHSTMVFQKTADGSWQIVHHMIMDVRD
jgi:uncharacterized protein (TIGR02246 family)